MVAVWKVDALVLLLPWGGWRARSHARAWKKKLTLISRERFSPTGNYLDQSNKVAGLWSQTAAAIACKRTCTAFTFRI